MLNYLSGIAAAYDRFAAVSRATRDAAAAADICFVHDTYAVPSASAFARRNAHRVTSLGCFVAPNFASIRMYSQLRDLELKLGRDRAEVALLPRSLTELTLNLRGMRTKWKVFRPLCCLQVLKIYNLDQTLNIRVQLDDSFATALPLLRVFHVAFPGIRSKALATTAKVVMPHLVELKIYHVKIKHLDLHFMSALISLTLLGCIVSTVSAPCSNMRLKCGWRDETTVLVTPNLRSLTVEGVGLHKLDGSRCRHALGIWCKNKCSIEWVGARPNVEYLKEVRY